MPVTFNSVTTVIRSSAVAMRPHDVLELLDIFISHSRSFETTHLTRACVSTY